MPIVKRATYDMLEMSSWCDIMINPVNCRGVMGAGLALAFKEKYPEMYTEYRVLCIEGGLVPGKQHIYYDDKEKTTIINTVTKNHWIDTSNLYDIELGLQTLVPYLLNYPKYVVAIPMLGAGLGKLDQNLVYALFERYLDPLPNIIFVCMRPDSLIRIPQYLVIAGSREYTDYLHIDMGVMVDGMGYFGTTKKDFDAFVSGGARGVDTIACGTGLPGDVTPNIAKEHGVKAIVAQADWDRYGNTAGFIRNKTLLEIGTHFILFIGSRSVGTRMMKDLVDRHNRDADKLIEEDEMAHMHQPDYRAQLVPTKARKQLYVHDVSRDSR